MLVLDERDQVQVVLTLDDEDPLAGVTFGVRVLQDVEQVTTLDMESRLAAARAHSRWSARARHRRRRRAAQVRGDEAADEAGERP